MNDPLTLTMRDGGATFDARTLAPVHPADGFAVALTASAPVPCEREDVGRALIALALRWPHVPFVGTWRGPGGIYVDAVVILPDRESAMTLARATGQQAIWDFATGEELAVGRSHETNAA